MKTRDICGVDKRCAYALCRITMSLVEKGLARRYKRGIYLIGSKEVDMTATAKKVRTMVSVFELPQKLGILQYIEYEPLPREWCTDDGCLYEGVLATEECRKGICLHYCVWVYSRDRRRWEAKERWRRRREDAGGCIKQQMAYAL